MALDKIVHKNILIQILKDIFGHHDLGPLLGFKGGTAAYLFYGLPRFSVDLDFDLLDASQEYFVFEEVKNLLEKRGTVKEAEKKRFNLFYSLSYDNKAPGAQNIKVEINRRAFGSKYAVKQYLGIAMKVMVEEDMAAHKFMAMLERLGKTNRDIFDVWYFLEKRWPINKELMEKRAGISFKEFLQKCINELERMSNDNILAGMGELLDEKQKAWAKANLKKDAIFWLKVRLEQEK